MNSKHIKKTFRRQHDQADCGVACLISLAQYYGGFAHFEQVRLWSGTTREGTTLLGLYEGGRKLGFTTKGVQADMQAVRDHGQALVLHVVMNGNLQHYVVYYGEKEGKAIIGDPGEGVRELSFEELDEIWESKTCLLVEPNSSFEKKTTYQRKKWEWFKELILTDSQLLLVAFGLGAIIACLGLAQSVFNQILLDKILPSEQLSKVIAAVILLSFGLLVQAFLRVARQIMLLKQGVGFNLRTMRSFLGRMLKMPKSFFDNRKTGDFVARLNDTSRIQYFITNVLGNFAIDILILLSALSAQFFYLPQLGWASVLFTSVYIAVLIRFQPQLRKSQRKLMEEYAHTESSYINSLQGIEAIKNRSLSDHFLERNMRVYKNLQDRSFQLGGISVHLGLVAETFGILYLLSVLGIGIWAYVAIGFTIGKLIAVLGISGMIVPSLSKIILTTVNYQEFVVAFDRLYELHAKKTEQQEGTKINNITTLECNDISFRFPGRKMLFEGVNFSIKKGEMLGLLGENGSGKSTWIGILQGFYECTEGIVQVNGANISELQIEQYRKNMGVVPQQISIFNDTVFFNITGEELTEDALQKLSSFWETLGFDQFFSHLPQGLLTVIGEEAVRLSGGQKQMLSIARAIYHKPSFLILDEPTAAMDRQAEQFVVSLLKKLKKTTAILLITHRVHVLRNFSDGIYLLENARMSKRMQHDQLMATDNIYSYYFKELRELV